MKKINVSLQNNSYDVLIGENIFGKILSVWGVIGAFALWFWMLSAFDAGDMKIVTMKLNLSEKSKSFDSVKKIYDILLKKGFGRDSLIVAVGGGIIGDVAGFAAATFMRGIQLVHIPTTLLAAVDSSIGGKTGVNYFDSKNIVGAFYQPKLVLVDTNMLF